MDRTKSELLVVKSGDDYIRFSKEGYERCAMNKASVFPLAELDILREKCKSCFPDWTSFSLKKLTITEEPFTPGVDV